MKRGFLIVIICITLLQTMYLVSSLILTVVTPLNGTISTNRSIQFNLTSNETSDFYLIENRLRSRSSDLLCSGVTSCNETRKLRMGNNYLRIVNINVQGVTQFKDIDVLIDSVAPRLIKVTPKSGFINNITQFVVEYSEENLKKITLFYNETSLSVPQSISKTTCPSGNHKSCSFNITNLGLLDDERLRFYFELEDIANNTKNSSVYFVNVDTIAPVIGLKSYLKNKNKITFNISVQEKNFDKIALRDNSAKNPVLTRVCSKLFLGTCIFSKTFSKGKHEIDVVVLDEAGNKGEVYSQEVIEI